MEDLDAEALQRGAVQPVAHQERAIAPVQGRRGVDADVIFRVQRADLHCEGVFTLKNNEQIQLYCLSVILVLLLHAPKARR